MDLKTLNIVLVGVGGQGTIRASDILAELGLHLGYDVKKAEVHGMSQRGGSVVSHLRWGPQVFSPIISLGEADALIAFEKLEAARFVKFLRPGGLALVNDYEITPTSVSSGGSIYPSDDAVRATLSGRAQQIVWVRAAAIADELHNPRVANVAMIGALSALLCLDPAACLDVLSLRIPPKFLEINKLAFEAGRKEIA